MTLSRRSCESVRAIYAGLLSPADSVNHISAAKGTPADSVRVETALNHGGDFLSYGARPYNWAPALLEAFWSALLFLDLATIGLLLLGKLRVGLALAATIMISDVAANSDGFFVLGIPDFKVALPLQAAARQSG